jgi:hypothetical protein
MSAITFIKSICQLASTPPLGWEALNYCQLFSLQKIALSLKVLVVYVIENFGFKTPSLRQAQDKPSRTALSFSQASGETRALHHFVAFQLVRNTALRFLSPLVRLGR